ncbi:hypothetical protein CWATWH8502_830 [Crocosphaera watsonii WH 8502]|uniref:Uncharacterized protein n=1 Tax=Crocosphaera watsonii WH 8502 TaxID=423474 RepID=T2IAV9_CROWT|nr:hypothetical protein CWATWH8502_830 [Crocosphaera watsonii WH 8502]
MSNYEVGLANAITEGRKNDLFPKKTYFLYLMKNQNESKIFNLVFEKGFKIIQQLTMKNGQQKRYL